MIDTKAKSCARTLASSLGGIAVGVGADYLAGDVKITLGSVVLALLLSPVVVPFGGKAVVPGFLASGFLLGGLLFWPVYIYLVWRSFAKRDSYDWLWILGWCAQGFFQIVHRLELVMSA